MSPTLRALSALDEERAAEVTEGLHVAIRRVFGEAAAYSVLDDLTALGHARRRAIGVKMATEKEAAAAAESLTEYYAMLCALARPYSKEAEEVLGDAMPPLPFGWKSSIDGAAEVAKSPKLVLERAAILYNLAVAHWSRGMLLPKADVEQIKTAARHFQIASGILDEVATFDVPAELDAKAPLPAELQPECAKALALTMLAQAQECFCDKAQVDGMAVGTRIKLLLGARDAYASASDAIAAAAASTPTATPLKRFKTWAEPPTRASQYKSEARAFWLAANPSPTPGVGLGLALALRAQGAAARAVAAVGSIPDELARRVVVDLAGEVDAAVAKLRRDNDTVYYESVPPEGSLPALDGKVLAKAVPVITIVEAAEAKAIPLAIWPGRRGASAVGMSDDGPSPPSPAALFLSLTGIPRATRNEIKKTVESEATEAGVSKETSGGSFFSGLWGGGALSPAGKVGASSSATNAGSGGGTPSRSKNDQISRVQEILARGREARAATSPSECSQGSSGSRMTTSQQVGDGGSEDAELQAAIEASLRENGPSATTARKPPPPAGQAPLPIETPEFPGLPRRSSGKASGLPPPPPYGGGNPPPPPYASSAPPPPGDLVPPPPSFEAATAAPTPAAVEAMISQLAALGVGRDRAANALRKANFDAAAAADLLFAG